MTIKQQGGIFGRNPTFNDVGASTVDTTDLYTNNISVGTDFQIEPVTLLRTTGNNANNPVIAVSAGAVDKYATIDVYRGSSSSQIGWTFNTMYGSLAEAFTVTPSGNIAFPSGQGIDFSATSGTGTSELFSDYEEGSFSPTITDGSVEASYGGRLGRYTKVGRAVHIELYFINVNTTGLTAGNSIVVGGLPFSHVTQSFNKAILNVQAHTLASTNGAVSAALASAATTMTLIDGTSTQIKDALTVAALTSGTSDLYISGTYEAA